MYSFSIIIPTLNQAAFLAETIDSILNQNYPYKEIIVIDGGSTDATLDILKSYSTKIKWLSEKDHGQADAINKGLRLATGDIFTYLNSDDYYLPECLASVNDFFKQNNGYSWVTGDYKIINEQGNPIQRLIPIYKNIFKKIPFFNALLFTNFIAQPSTFWRREVFTRTGFFNESLNYVMDYEYWLRIKNNYKLGFIQKPLACFRIHSQSKGGVSYKNQFNEELKVLQMYCHNSVVLWLHQLHNWLIVKFYDLLKK
jgi:glycosyltransferase involved in cell wall biosynthesis